MVSGLTALREQRKLVVTSTQFRSSCWHCRDELRLSVGSLNTANWFFTAQVTLRADQNRHVISFHFIY